MKKRGRPFKRADEKAVPITFTAPLPFALELQDASLECDEAESLSEYIRLAIKEKWEREGRKA